MKDNWKSYLSIAIIIGSIIAFNMFATGPSQEEYIKAGIEILSEDNYKSLISDSNKPVMILFKSENCNVCKIFASRFIDFASTHKEMARYFVADANNINLDRFGIRAYPTTRIYYKGKLLEEMVGNGSLTTFQKRLESIK